MGNYPSGEYNPYTGSYEYNGYQTELDRYNRRIYSSYNSYYPSMGYVQQSPNYYNSYGQQQYYPSAYQSAYQSPYNSMGYGGYGGYQQAAYGTYNTTPQYVSSMYGSPNAYGAYNSYYPYNTQRPYM